MASPLTSNLALGDPHAVPFHGKGGHQLGPRSCWWPRTVAPGFRGKVLLHHHALSPLSRENSKIVAHALQSDKAPNWLSLFTLQKYQYVQAAFVVLLRKGLARNYRFELADQVTPATALHARCWWWGD